MNLNQYASWTDTTATYPSLGTRNIEEREYLALGLIGETGELLDKYKKFKRGDGKLDIEGMRAELGDVLWYWARLCRTSGLEPTSVAEKSSSKPFDSTTLALLTLGKWSGQAGLIVVQPTVHPYLFYALSMVYDAWSHVCLALDFSPGYVMMRNVDKLEDRKARKVLQGSGDNR